MNKQEEIINVTPEDLEFLEKELSKTNMVYSLEDLAKKLAFRKSASQLSKELKKYDPYCSYEIGDLIYKEYDEALVTSSKGTEPFKGSVVLRVVNKIPYDSFNCDMLEVEYSGGGTFRKHIEYMKKTKTQILLPCNLERKSLTPEIMQKTEDPRQSELPITEKDLKKLEKNLRSSLSKSKEFFNWNDYWHLTSKKIEIPEEKIEEIEKYMSEKRVSTESGELVSKFLGIQPEDETFSLHCLSLNHILDKRHKKNFIFVSPLGWGKWQLKEILDSFLIDIPLAASHARVPLIPEETRETGSKVTDFPLKIYLGWREILSGGVKIPRSLSRELSKIQEYIFTDAEEGKDYTLYFYPDQSIFLGLKDYYESNNVPQGASLTLERKGFNRFLFWFKKSKKKLSFSKLNYDPQTDRFFASGEEASTYLLHNKIIHLEEETLRRLLPLFDSRDDLDLKQLLILIFKNFGLEENNYMLHYLRAYHLVDLLKCTTQEDVEAVLLSSSEFIASEKKKGIFYYREEEKIEKPFEILPEIPEVQAGKEREAEEMPEEMELEKQPVFEEPEIEVLPEEREEREEIRLSPPLEPEKVEYRKPPKAKKEVKKKFVGIEAEKGFRKKKGERKVIEERIELEESEYEALLAIKAKEKKEAEEEQMPLQAKEKKEEFKSPVSEKPVFGFFADKLKSALDKKKKEEEKK